jgi:hypothetical protein
MSFDSEMEDAFEACLDDFTSDRMVVRVAGSEVSPVVVDSFSESEEILPGGKKSIVSCHLHMRESTRLLHQIEKGTVVDLPRQNRRVRVLEIEDHAAGQRTLICGPVNQR